MTIGERYNPAMKIIDQAKATAYWEWLVTTCMEHGNSREKAEEIERSNLGYYAGYFGQEERERVKQLFGAIHPIFGDATPTPEEAFKMGFDRAKS